MTVSSPIPGEGSIQERCSHRSGAFRSRNSTDDLARSQLDMISARREPPSLLDVDGAEQGHETDPASTALGDDDTACLPGSRD